MTDSNLLSTKGLKREDLSYRQSVVSLVLDNENNILLVQKKNYDDHQWDIPGGGIHTDVNESAEDALMRELEEELGVKDFEIIKKSNIVDQYEWPDEVILRKLTEKERLYRGQQRLQFLVKFTGNKDNIIFPPDEIKAVKWVNLKDLEKYMVFPDQWEKTKELVTDFSL